MKICSVCDKEAIGQFNETQDNNGFTISGDIPISEAPFCEEHESNVSDGLHGEPVYYSS